METEYDVTLYAEIKLPDLKWHSFSKEKPKPGVPILVRTIERGRKYYFVHAVDDTCEKHCFVYGDAEWQYINEESYELSVEETKRSMSA